MNRKQENINKSQNVVVGVFLVMRQHCTHPHLHIASVFQNPLDFNALFVNITKREYFQQVEYIRMDDAMLYGVARFKCGQQNSSAFFVLCLYLAHPFRTLEPFFCFLFAACILEAKMLANTSTHRSKQKKNSSWKLNTILIYQSAVASPHKMCEHNFHWKLCNDKMYRKKGLCFLLL